MGMIRQRVFNFLLMYLFIHLILCKCTWYLFIPVSIFWCVWILSVCWIIFISFSFVQLSLLSFSLRPWSLLLLSYCCLVFVLHSVCQDVFDHTLGFCKHTVGTSPSFAYCFDASLFDPQHFFSGCVPCVLLVECLFRIPGGCASLMMAIAIFVTSFSSSGCFMTYLLSACYDVRYSPHFCSFSNACWVLNNSFWVHRRTVHYGWLWRGSARIWILVINYSLLTISCDLDIKKWKLLKR